MKKITHFFLILLLGLSVFSCDQEEDTELPVDGKVAANFPASWVKTWGTTYADDFAGAALGSDGNLYITGASQPDGYAADIFISQVNLTNETVGWSKSLDLGNQDSYSSTSENGHSQGGGGSRCIALDASNNIYIAGTSRQGFNEVFAAKFGNSGNLVWEKHWHADNSGLAHGAAKAYTLAVAGEKVFVTGSSGGGTGTEDAFVFLLTLETASGEIDTAATHVGIELSTGYNDKGYSIVSKDGNEVLIAGWEGKNNSGFILKFTDGGKTLSWFERINVGYGCRLTDIDLDASGNIYLAADIRGVSTYMGILKLNSSGILQWGKKYQGESNDRNNISCVRYINNYLYVGGKGSFTNYDLSKWGDACLLKISSSGDLVNAYNYYANKDGLNTGERIEGIFDFNGKILLAGETWPEGDNLKGGWYIPTANYSDFNPAVTVSTDVTIASGDGFLENRTFSINSLSITLKDIDMTQGSCDIAIYSISE